MFVVPVPLPARRYPTTSRARALYTIGLMAVTVEMHNTGDSGDGAQVTAVIEHVLSDRAGEWHVTILGSHENDDWEMKIEGPSGFQRLYTLVGAAGDHQPEAIRNLLPKLLPPRNASSNS